MDFGILWDETVRLFHLDAGNRLRIIGSAQPGDACHIGVVNRRHRLFLPGDVLLCVVSNGDARWPVWCRTSRGFSVRDYYLGVSLRHMNWGALGEFWTLGQRGTFNVVDPGKLAGLPPTSPAVRQFVVDVLHTGEAAGRIGVGSPTLFESQARSKEDACSTSRDVG